jgi:hypothetical protein
MIDATFRVIFFPKKRQHIALAWNYEEAILVTTKPHATYTAAREELTEISVEREFRLRFFDGDYEHTGPGDQITSAGARG